MVKFPAKCANTNKISNPPEIPTIHFFPIDDIRKTNSGFGWRGPV